MKFDVFISHCRDAHPWVAVLADNLQRCGLTVWHDALADETPSAPAERQAALAQSNHGLLVISPEALNPHWLNVQHETLRQRQRQYPDFRTAGLCLTGAADTQPDDSVAWLNFTDPSADAYCAGLRQLLAVLRHQPKPGPTKLVIPSPLFVTPANLRPFLLPTEKAALQTLFERLQHNPMLLLLAPQDTDCATLHRAIFTAAQQRYGIDRALHLTTLGLADASRVEYLSHLGEQLGQTAPCTKPGDLEFLLASRMRQSKALFLLVNGIEDGAVEGRRALAQVLRNLSERHAGRLHSVLCGGERLLDLRCKEGNLSLLHRAEPLLWPALGVADVLAWAAAQNGRLPSVTEAGHLLALTGGNARHLQQGLHALALGQPLDAAALAQGCRDDPRLHQQFAVYRDSPDAPRLASLLQRDDLGSYQLWPISALIRRLYWEGLITERQGRLRWRSEAIRQIGLELLRI